MGESDDGTRAGALSEHDALLRVAAAAAGAQGLDEVLELTAEEARRAIGAASLAVSRWERDANLLRTLINVGTLGPSGERFPAHETYEVREGSNLERLLLRGRPYFSAVDDPAADPASVELLRASEKDSEVAVPIVVEAESWGAVWAATAPGEPRFRGADVRFLEAIAGQLAVAIERAELFSRVSRLAYEDPLTGLANRRALDERLERSTARADLRDGQVTVLLCDVDDLKAINDERGHEAGDRALRRVAEALVAAAADHPGSIVGRLSGDEFCVVIEGGDLAAARGIGGAALRALSANRDMPISISCGAATRGPATHTREQLLRAADAAQYAAKRKGGGQVCTAAPGREPRSAGDERRVFRGTPEQRVGAAVRVLQDRLDGELSGLSALDRLEAVTATLAEAVNAAGWTVSHVQAGGRLIRSIANANTRDLRLRGVRVGLDDEIYPVDDYPATAALVDRGSGAFLTSCDDPLADEAECSLLQELGFDSVVVAAAADASGSWLVEIYGDQETSGLPDARPAVALLARAALPPPRPEARGQRGGAGHSEVLIALSTRLAAGEEEAELLEAVVDELARAFQTDLAAVLRVGGGLLETVAFRSPRCADPGWTQPADAGIVGRCLRERLPVVTGDVLTEPDYREMAPELDVRSELAVPVFVDGRTWGAIDLESQEADAFDGEDARVVRAAAAQLGSALARLSALRSGQPAPAS
jgi:diguanylate cyclase (GGDEF)-like protein